jgi:hypothetical protein
VRIPPAAVLLLAGAAVADDPRPGTVVIRPKGSAVAAPPDRPADPEPDRPGYIVIRPGGRPAGTPRRLDADPSPRPAARQTPPTEPVPTPIPTPVPTPAPAADKPAAKEPSANGRLVQETWDAAYLKGMRVGYYRVTVREHEKEGKTYLHATREQRLTVGRFGQRVEIWAEDSSTELPDGTVLAVRMRQGLSKDQVLGIVGHVKGNALSVQGEGGAAGASNQVPWPEGVLGIAKEANVFRDRRPKPGDTFDYRFYLGQLNRVMTVTVTAKAIETVAIIEGQPPRKMLRLEAVTETLKNPAGRVVFRLAPATVWCDAETFEPLRTDQDMPSLGGRLTILRTTKEVATRAPGKVPDLFDVQSIRLDQEIPDVHGRAAVTYRVSMPNDADPADAFALDARQAVRNPSPDGHSFDLAVTAVRSPGGAADPKPGDEYRSSNFFVTSDDPEVRKHAAAATAGLPASATDWDKARAVERWVRQNMRAVEFSQAMATASQVAKSLSGDCTEYAMLAAAMCRAVGVPSRTALGLVYAPGPGGKPFLAYHMWFEVYAGGSWVALDGTLGLGSVGPGHIKITDASWHNERSFAPLLPVLRVLNGTPTVEVGK